MIFTLISLSLMLFDSFMPRFFVNNVGKIDENRYFQKLSQIHTKNCFFEFSFGKLFLNWMYFKVTMSIFHRAKPVLPRWGASSFGSPCIHFSKIEEIGLEGRHRLSLSSTKWPIHREEGNALLNPIQVANVLPSEVSKVWAIPWSRHKGLREMLCPISVK